MKHIVSIAFALDDQNFDEVIEFKGDKIRITQYCVNFDLDLTKEIIKNFDGKCDAFAVSGMPPKYSWKGGEFFHPDSRKIFEMETISPILSGQILKNIYIPWSIRKLYSKDSTLIKNKDISFYSGALNFSMIEVFSEFSNNILLADPYTLMNAPFVLNGKLELDKFMKFLTPVFKRLKLKKGAISDFSSSSLSRLSFLKKFYESDVFVSNEAFLNLIDISHLRDKTVVVDFLSENLKNNLMNAGVREVVVCMPNVGLGHKVNFAILEAIFQSHNENHTFLDANEVLNWIDQLELKPEIVTLDLKFKKNDSKFAFVIHPLHKDHFFKHKLMKPMKNILKPIDNIIEKGVSKADGFFYGTIEGIKSEKTGKRVEGYIYSMYETPKMMLSQDPETIYKKLVKLSKDAKKRGASLIGLGAYTKIVGDAGVTVNDRSPIPVTTGNSLSACSTLWAAKLAVEKLNFVKKDSGRFQGTVMVVGATGSIGAVSAKILAQKWKRLILVAPRAYKLLELRDDILKIDNNVEIEVATSADKHASDCDLIITTTSAQGKKVLDIEKVKPGCVICDVSRPLDISEEDALKRPDVMVIESGEVQLPGDYRLNVDIGLDGNIVYACLAETALLSMEGRHESFTLSRNINYKNVLEIDRMARDHGVRLSSIMGHAGIITDHEFDLCRQHAQQKLKELNG